MNFYKIDKQKYIKWCQNNLNYEFDYDRAFFLIDKPERATAYASKFSFYCPADIEFNEPNYMAIPWYGNPNGFNEGIIITNKSGGVTFYDSSDGYNQLPLQILVPPGNYIEGELLGWFYILDVKFDDTTRYQKNLKKDTTVSLSLLHGKDLDVRCR